MLVFPHPHINHKYYDLRRTRCILQQSKPGAYTHLIKILGNNLTSFTSHYAGHIDKHQCRFTDWSYIQRQHHNEISTLTWLGFQSDTTLMKPWSPALSFWLISCFSVEGFWADSRIENHFLLCSHRIKCLLQRNIQGLSLQGAQWIIWPFKQIILWLSYVCIAVNFRKISDLQLKSIQTP